MRMTIVAACYIIALSGLRANFGYAGEDFSHDSGITTFKYNRARYYDPSTGSFILKDPLGIQDGPIAYSYCNGIWGQSLKVRDYLLLNINFSHAGEFFKSGFYDKH
jgi:RHS repeat-associated protein